METHDINIAVGERIRKRRKELNLSIKQLSEITGIKLGSISNYELGKRELTVETLRILAKGLGVNISYLVEVNSTSNVSPVANKKNKRLGLGNDLIYSNVLRLTRMSSNKINFTDLSAEFQLLGNYAGAICEIIEKINNEYIAASFIKSPFVTVTGNILSITTEKKPVTIEKKEYFIDVLAKTLFYDKTKNKGSLYHLVADEVVKNIPHLIHNPQYAQHLVEKINEYIEKKQ